MTTIAAPPGAGLLAEAALHGLQLLGRGVATAGQP